MSKRRGSKKVKGGGRCFWCHRPLLASNSKSATARTRDHFYPASEGGRYTVVACFTCNNVKANMTPDVWHAFRQANPQWWVTFKRKPFSRAAA